MNNTTTSFTSNQEFSHLFDQHIGTVFARQLLFATFLKVKEEPAINLQQEHVEFSNGQKYGIALLGTQLEADHTFLWAWSDENTHVFPSNTSENNFSAPFAQTLLQTAQQMKSLGQNKNIAALSEPKVILELSTTPLTPDEFNGDHIACLAAGLFNKAYWRDTRDEGVVYYIITSTPEEITGTYTVPHILNTIEQVVSYFATNNKTMLESFLQQQGFTGKWEDIQPEEENGEEEEDHIELGCTYTAYRGDEEITATFDEDDALVEIEAHGFEGEQAYQNNNAGDDDFDMNELLGQWPDVTTPHAPVSSVNHSGEFPPPLPSSLPKKP